MNPHAEPPASLQGMFRTLWVHRQLIARMSQREVIGRYRGSALGLVWSFLTPLFMLSIYTFVFSVVFKARWGAGEESRTQFAIVLFAGLIGSMPFCVELDNLKDTDAPIHQPAAMLVAAD